MNTNIFDNIHVIADFNVCIFMYIDIEMSVLRKYKDTFLLLELSKKRNDIVRSLSNNKLLEYLKKSYEYNFGDSVSLRNISCKIDNMILKTEFNRRMNKNLFNQEDKLKLLIEYKE